MLYSDLLPILQNGYLWHKAHKWAQIFLIILHGKRVHGNAPTFLGDLCMNTWESDQLHT